MIDFSHFVLLLLVCALLIFYAGVGLAVWFTRDDFPPYAPRVFVGIVGFPTIAFIGIALAAIGTHQAFFGV